MQTYTQGGYSPQQQQLAQGQPNAVNSMPPPGSPSSSYGSDEALSSKYAAANASMMTANSPDTRQQLVNNSNIPAMQSNYDDLARQLFEYDQGVLSPKFQGTNPGTPTDAPSFGRVEASPLGMTMESAGLSADKGLYNPNPKYAYAAQTTQGNSIIDLLDKLIGGINSGMTDVKGKNASNVAQAQSALDTVYKIMGLKEEARQKELDRAERAAEKAATKGKETTDKTQAIWDSLYASAKTERDIWKAINENQDAWGGAGVNVKQLWQWHKNLASRVGRNGAVGAGTGVGSEYSNERTTRVIQSVDELMEQVDDSTTGAGSYLSLFPGTKAKTFKSQLDTLKANISFNELQEMRNASKTGGALGQVSNIELKLLQSALGALDRAQSPADFKKQLQKVRDSIQRFESAKGGGGNQKNNNKSNDPLGIR